VFDLNRTLQLIVGALFNPAATWERYRPEADNWQRTAVLITGPVIIASSVLGYLLGLFRDDGIMAAMQPTLLNTVINIVVGLLWIGIVAFIFGAVAGAFGGRSSFARGLAATSLAFVPAYFGQALARLPWIGALLGLGLFIYALVLLWRIIPAYLEVPDSRRASHYVVSLLACIVLGIAAGMLLRPIMGPPGAGLGRMSDSGLADSGKSAEHSRVSAFPRTTRAPKYINEAVAHGDAPFRDHERDLVDDIARSIRGGRTFKGV